MKSLGLTDAAALLRNWMNSNGFADETWVRFDSDGDRVDIPTYAW